MTMFIIEFEDGPCAWNCGAEMLEADSEQAACDLFEERNPRAMITAVYPLPNN